MVEHAVGNRLDYRSTLAFTGSVSGLFNGLINRKHVVAIDTVMGNAVGDGLLGEGFGGGLLAGRHGNTPLIVLDDHHHRGIKYAGKTETIVKIAFGGAAFANKRQTNRVPTCQFVGHG